MCGGISGALAVATRTDARGRPRLDLLACYQIGRIASYALAGASVAGIGSALLSLVDQEQVRIALRWLTAVLFALVGLSLLMRGRGFDLSIGRRLWTLIAPLARRLLPVRSVPQALALGALWGWMPCGLVYSVLLDGLVDDGPAAQRGDHAAIRTRYCPGRARRSLRRQTRSRIAAARRLPLSHSDDTLVMSVVTASGPWLAEHSGLHAMAGCHSTARPVECEGRSKRCKDVTRNRPWRLHKQEQSMNLIYCDSRCAEHRFFHNSSRVSRTHAPGPRGT
jgi:hypothetical protein